MRRSLYIRKACSDGRGETVSLKLGAIHDKLYSQTEYRTTPVIGVKCTIFRLLLLIKHLMVEESAWWVHPGSDLDLLHCES